MLRMGMGWWILLVTIILQWPRPTSSQQTRPAVSYSNGVLNYFVDTEGNRVPDFSYAGYNYGVGSTPVLSVATVLTPSNDDRSNIQNAIDQLSSVPPDQNGFRGAILLKAGTYQVDDTITISASGIVIRGEGPSKTIVQGVGVQDPTLKKAVLSFSGNFLGYTTNTLTTRYIATDVQIGDTQIVFNSFTPYNPGDRIMIIQPTTIAWLKSVNYGGAGREKWNPLTFLPFQFYRKVVSVNGKVVQLDAPIPANLRQKYAISYAVRMEPFKSTNFVSNVGLENLSIPIQTQGGNSENHFWIGAQFGGVENFWATGCVFSGFAYAGIVTYESYLGTISNCVASKPVARMMPERMYNFCANENSQNVLFHDLQTNGGRHPFIVNGGASASTIVFFRSKAAMQHDTVESHRWWSLGILFDNLTLSGPSSLNITFGLYNRGIFGTGHGWACANCVGWNIFAELAIVLEKPPTAQNYCVGCHAPAITGGPPAPFPGITGWVESPNSQPDILSLYTAQFNYRQQQSLNLLQSQSY